MSGVFSRARAVWRNDFVRLFVLTLYYLAIVAGIIAIYGGQTYSPPPYIYQGF